MQSGAVSVQFDDFLGPMQSDAVSMQSDEMSRETREYSLRMFYDV